MINASPFQPGDKVVCYCRYSEGDDQGLKNTSVDEQEQAIRQFCDQNSLELVKVFADPFASGRSVAKRDKYLEMLSFLLHGKKKNDIAGVILWDYERYGRNYDRAQYDAAQLRMKGYKLFSMQQPITDNSPFAHVLESMYFASAQNQSDMISADVKRAKQANFTKYKAIPRSNIPDGWMPVPVDMGYLTNGEKRIGYRAEPDPEYIDKIRDAVQARLDGATIAQCKNILGGKFSELPIKTNSLFKKTLLYGAFTYGGTTIEDYCTPIIDKATFDKLQIFNETAPKRKRSKGAGVYALQRSLLSGLIYCGECGERMYLDRRKAKGHTYETYYCSHYHIGVRREVIEDSIMDHVLEWLSDEHWQKDLQGITDAFRSDLEGSIDKSSIEKQIREIDRKLKRLYDTLMAADVSPQFITQKMVELEQERGVLYDQLHSSNDEYIEKMRETAEKARSRILMILRSQWTDTDEKREALEACIDRITISKLGKKKLQVMVERPLPGFGSVASDFAKNYKRPSSVSPYTCNLVTEVIIVDCRYFDC